MLKFDANTNIDASVNGPLNFHGDVDADENPDVKREHTFTAHFHQRRRIWIQIGTVTIEETLHTGIRIRIRTSGKKLSVEMSH